MQQQAAAPPAPPASGGGVSAGAVKSDEQHPVRASSLPAFSTDLHKHHVTAHRETPPDLKEKNGDELRPGGRGGWGWGHGKTWTWTGGGVGLTWGLRLQPEGNRVKSGALSCSCGRSSSSRCPGSAPAAAWTAGGRTPAWTTRAHLGEQGRSQTHNTLQAEPPPPLLERNSPLNVISKAPVDISWFSIMLLRKNTIMQAYTCKQPGARQDTGADRCTWLCCIIRPVLAGALGPWSPGARGSLEPRGLIHANTNGNEHQGGVQDDLVTCARPCRPECRGRREPDLPCSLDPTPRCPALAFRRGRTGPCRR